MFPQLVQALGSGPAGHPPMHARIDARINARSRNLMHECNREAAVADRLSTRVEGAFRGEGLWLSKSAWRKRGVGRGGFQRRSEGIEERRDWSGDSGGAGLGGVVLRRRSWHGVRR